MQMENQLGKRAILEPQLFLATRAMDCSHVSCIAAQQKVTGHMQKSTEVMTMMNKLSKVSEMQATMQEMQKEMCKAGVIEEMVDDAFEVLDGDDDEDAADDEVERVMQELNAETMSTSKATPSNNPVQQAEAEEEE